jgi:hypothetical protein
MQTELWPVSGQLSMETWCALQSDCQSLVQTQVQARLHGGAGRPDMNADPLFAADGLMFAMERKARTRAEQTQRVQGGLHGALVSIVQHAHPALTIGAK